jgi:hypothetical protein
VTRNTCHCYFYFANVSNACTCLPPRTQTTTKCKPSSCSTNPTPLNNFMMQFLGSYPKVPSNAVNNLISSYGISGQPDVYITYMVTNFVNLFATYPICGGKYAGAQFACVNNTAYNTMDLYYTGILLYTCNGPWCGSNQHFVNGTCYCNDGYVYYNETYCVSPNGISTTTVSPRNNCPLYETLINNTCQCSSGFIRDPNSGRCVCPPGFHILNSTCLLVAAPTGRKQCTCPENEFYDYVQRKCLCLDGFYRDPSTRKCLIGNENI